MNAPVPTTAEWSTERIRVLVLAKFGKRACWYQIKVAKALYAGRNVLGCAPTGAGKTLSFWIPLLMALKDKKKKILFVVTPLTVLGKQNVGTLQQVGIPAISVTAENAHEKTFKV